MTQKIRPIPLTDYGYIDYGGEVLVIRKHSIGDKANYQFNGCACSQGVVTGYVVASFKTKSKWFSEAWWYRRAVWLDDFNKSYFTSREGWEFDKINFLMKDDEWERFQQQILPTSRTFEQCLNAVLKHAREKTGLDMVYEGDPNAYGMYSGWAEAHVPVTIAGKKHLLTWMNCD